MNDSDLLTQYIRDHSQEAFAALVRQHLNLVYSAARRQVRSPHLAEDVAQSVFVELARNAHRIKPRVPLGAWLHLVTRRMAINAARDEFRRRARERDSADLLAMNSPTSAWAQVEPLLDEAVAALPDTDRVAVVLRYFENRSLREIGVVLGTSEDAAQKRVSRALDQLRTLLAKHGVAATAASLATDLSAHAIESAPAALAATISSGAITVAATGLGAAAFETTKTIAMTTFQKSAVAAAVLLLAGAGIHEAQAWFNQRDALDAARGQRTAVFGALQQTQRRRAGDARSLVSTRDQIASLQALAAASKGGAEEALEAEMRAWYAREEALRQVVLENPGWGIPELQLLTDRDWFNAAQETKLSTPDEVRRTLGNLRSTAKGNLASRLMPAVQAYAAAYGDMLPANPTELMPFFDPPVDSAALVRYRMTRTGRIGDLPQEFGPRVVMLERDSADPEFDSQYQIGLNGVSASDWLGIYVREAQLDFAQANGGAKATTPDQLRPYLKTPLDPAKLAPLLK